MALVESKSTGFLTVRETHMRKHRNSGHPHDRRKHGIVPPENHFESSPRQGLRGLEYFELITSAEHCVRSDIERERALQLDPTAIVDYLHRMASVA
jgi:hypothetical protein